MKRRFFIKVKLVEKLKKIGYYILAGVPFSIGLYLITEKHSKVKNLFEKLL